MKYRPFIKVYLEENGIYVLDGYSATGKTYLCNVLKEKCRFGEPVIGYSYEDYQLGINIEDMLVPGKFKLILIDMICLRELGKISLKSVLRLQSC